MADGIAGSTIIPLEEFSELQKERLSYEPQVPSTVAALSKCVIEAGDATAARSNTDSVALKSWFPKTFGQPIVNFAAGTATTPVAARKLRVGVLFCGRQSPGGHNVVAGLFDGLQSINHDNELLGFEGGTKGLFDGKTVTITSELLSTFRNQGGFHLLGRSVDRIRSTSEQAAALATASRLELDGLVLLGGTFTCTDAAHLAEYVAEHQTGKKKTCVVGVPVSIDGDMRNQFVETTLGHDTATKVFSQLVGNMATDANSAKKYTYFVRLMGRAYGHITLEVAMQTQPNVVLLGEEIEERKMTLTDIVRELADVVAERAAAGKNFGVVLVPEGTINAIPEIRTLIAEMNVLFTDGVDPSIIPSRLTPWSSAVLSYLPPLIRQQLFLERESSGAVQLSQISTERMLADLVGSELERRKADGKFKGKYASVTHFFGYQARSSLPSNFDCNLGIALGRTATGIIAGGLNGYCATVRNLDASFVSEWQPTAVPLTAMMSVPAPGTLNARVFGAKSAGAGKVGVRPVIESAPVDVNGGPFLEYKRRAAAWRGQELYTNPGPIQFDGITADDGTVTLQYEQHDYMDRITTLRKQLDEIRDACRPGVSETLLDAALTGVTSLAHILQVMKRKE